MVGGIFIGFTLLLYITGYGIGHTVTQNHYLALALKIISSIWLLYLAFLIKKPFSKTQTQPIKHVGFSDGFLLQFINPKGWIMAISAAGTFLPTTGNLHLNVFIFAFAFGLVGIPCMLTWIFFGDVLSKWITSDKSSKLIGWLLFSLMVLGILLVWK